ncbi:MAG: site-specific DNA-methyltransferase [Bacteroides sp.]|nr:site-specific DNA-methyltransferase [Bacteroides sp.]
MENVVLGGCTCYNGDCMELMAQLPDNSVDFILSDIPYDLDLNGGGTHGDFATRKQIQSRKNSSLYFVSQGIDYDKVFSEFERICKGVNVCVFCSNKQIGRIMTWWENRGYKPTLLILDKPNPIPLGNGNYINNLEFIIYIRSKGVTYNSLGYDMQMKTFHTQPPQAAQRIHETEKPVSLLQHLLLLHSNEGDVVFDAYAGSFSTAIACHETKRKFIGCEILPKYFEPAMKRLRGAIAQQSLF